MSTLAAVLLEHDLPGDRHFDWMFEDPDGGAADPALLCWRLAVPSWDWASARKLAATALPAHRRHYLTHEGPVSGERGVVRRVDAGTASVVVRSAGGFDLDVRLERFVGRVRLRRIEGSSWTFVAEAREVLH